METQTKLGYKEKGRAGGGLFERDNHISSQHQFEITITVYVQRIKLTNCIKDTHVTKWRISASSLLTH